MSELEDSFSEGELSHLCQRALFVQPAPRPIDLDTVPADGNEFIHKARLEDSFLKFHRLSDEEKTNSSRITVMSKIDKFWVRQAAVEFSQFANQLKSNREALQKKYQPTDIIPLNDEQECCSFCLGSEKCSLIFKSKTSIAAAHLPLVSHVIHLNQLEVYKLLQYTFKWYKSIGMDVDIGRWVFTLLACTDKPLIGKIEDFLETYFDDCKEYLKKESISESEELVRVHLVMSIMENYFCVKSNKHGAFFNHLVG